MTLSQKYLSHFNFFFFISDLFAHIKLLGRLTSELLFLNPFRLRKAMQKFPRASDHSWHNLKCLSIR